jgi:outer membrane receptor protein involved in Fe transport
MSSWRAACTAILAVATVLPIARLDAQAVSPPRGDSAHIVHDSVRTRTSRALAPVAVTGRIDNLLGSAATASEGRIGAVDLRARPVTREAELLETVPGLVATQHSGEGKANQYFVRGFNLDHGTDFSTSVEGMPLNLPTHAHGQGWTDVNFLIPELVDHVGYRLGVYHVELGDFSSAGGAEFHLVRRLARPLASVQAGAHSLMRVVAAASTELGGGDLLIGAEGRKYDGPWSLPGDVRKTSTLARWSRSRGASEFSILAMSYSNRWNAADQVPMRAVESGDIHRFGQVDSTGGGWTRRHSLSAAWQHAASRSVRSVSAYVVRSDMQLYSNFTYFLDDAGQGDQFSQADGRTILGASARNVTQVQLLGVAHTLAIGAQARMDEIGRLELARTRQREIRHRVRSDRARLANVGLYAQAQSQWTPWLRSVVGARADMHAFSVRSDHPENSGRRSAALVSPKASLILSPFASAEFYASAGRGFHSNDARGVVLRVDPLTGESASPADPLVRSRGAELGLRVASLNGLRTTVVMWSLDLDSELVFVGDAGGTEPSAASVRRGLTVANFWRAGPRLSFDTDFSVSRARLRGVDATEEHVPGALDRVLAGGISWNAGGTGAFGGLRLRHFGAYPLKEDGSVLGTATTLLNAEAGYALSSGARIRLGVLNVANARGYDIQYWYASRLRGEPDGGIEDVHGHPVEPRQVRLTLERQF